MVMGIQPAVMGAAQRAEGSEFEHDRLLKTRFMTAIIHQPNIDKKRKNCGITIESVDRKQRKND
jgi:hypothetical protein